MLSHQCGKNPQHSAAKPQPTKASPPNWQRMAKTKTMPAATNAAMHTGGVIIEMVAIYEDDPMGDGWFASQLDQHGREHLPQEDFPKLREEQEVERLGR